MKQAGINAHAGEHCYAAHTVRTALQLAHATPQHNLGGNLLSCVLQFTHFSTTCGGMWELRMSRLMPLG